MTKEQLYAKWSINPDFKSDINAVIAYEIEQALGQDKPAPKYPIGGYAPGHYMCRCANCKKEFIGDKRAVQCEPCAVKTTSKQTDQPAPNPIREAYERGLKVRRKKWSKNAWIEKLSETESTSDTCTTFSNNWDFKISPDLWELYTEPDAEDVEPKTEKTDANENFKNAMKLMGEGLKLVHEIKELNRTKFKQGGFTFKTPAKPKFDQERFEAMFRAVVASGEYRLNLIQFTELHIAQLDAFYATKKGGNNE